MDRNQGPSSRSRGRNSLRTTIDIALETVQILRDLIAMEPARGTLAAVSGLLILLQDYLQNADDLNEIAERCQRIALLLQKASETGSSHMTEAIVRFRIFIENMSAAIGKSQKRKRLIKVFTVRADKDKIEGLKEALRDFIAEFHLEQDIITGLDVRAILELVKKPQAIPQQPPPEPEPALDFFTPSKPPIFFGRDEIVQDIVNTLTRGEHVALTGPGGIGKSTISKAVLNEEPVVSDFEARLFVSYDNVSSSMMTYQLFLDRLGEALFVSKCTLPEILRRLRSLKALIVIDNAETFLEAGDADGGRISQTLDEIGALHSTCLIFTTRAQETIPSNITCKRLAIPSLDKESAIQAFASVYRIAPVDEIIEGVLRELEYHPLCVNILANAATMNQWSSERLAEAWEEGRSSILETANDKYRSLRVTIEISIACPAFRDIRDNVTTLLRTIAFLPQGIHRRDLVPLFPDIRRISSVADSLCRSSLAYWLGDRLTMLAPVRMYIGQEHNDALVYDDALLCPIRTHFLDRLTEDTEEYICREDLNLEIILFHDLELSGFVEHRLPSSTWLGDTLIHIQFALSAANEFNYRFTCLRMIYSLLDSVEVTNDREITWKAYCLVDRCMREQRDSPDEDHWDVLSKAMKIAEEFCQLHLPLCEQQIVWVYRTRGMIYESMGNLHLAHEVLTKGLEIIRRRNDAISLDHYTFECWLAKVAWRQGQFEQAESSMRSLQAQFESKKEFRLVRELIRARAVVLISQKKFEPARHLLDEAMTLSTTDAQRLETLFEFGILEGSAGNIVEAEELYNEVAQQVSESRRQYPEKATHLDVYFALAYHRALAGDYQYAFETARRPGRGNCLQLWRHRDFLPNATSAYIYMFQGKLNEAFGKLYINIDRIPEVEIEIQAMRYRDLGEIATLLGRDWEAMCHFRYAWHTCNEAGIPPNLLGLAHRYFAKLPETYYVGWETFLAENSPAELSRTQVMRLMPLVGLPDDVLQMLQ